MSALTQFKKRLKFPPLFWYARWHYDYDNRRRGEHTSEVLSGIQYVGYTSPNHQGFNYQRNGNDWALNARGYSFDDEYEDDEVYDEEDEYSAIAGDDGDRYMQGRGAP